VGTVNEILSHDASASVVIEISSDDLSQLQQAIKNMQGILEVNPQGESLELVCKENITATGVNKFCFERGIILNRLNIKRRSLETTFLELTGKVSER
jgi:ABC-2 type transport system ATP-binding protein